MTDPLGQSQVIPYLQGLSKNGYEIHLISCEKQHVFELRKAHIKNILAESNIVWHPVVYTKNPPVLSTLWDVLKMQKLSFQLHREHSFKLVHCRSYISALVGLKLQKKFGLKFIFDIRGFWADERVDGGIWNLNNPIFKIVYQFFKRKEKQFFEHADVVVSLTNAAKMFIENNFKLKNKVFVIPCAADLELFQAQNQATKKEYRKKLNLNDEFVLMYLGSIGTWYLLEDMLDFFIELKKEKPNSKFVLITGDDKIHIQNLAESKGISKDAILVQKANREEVTKYISVADASVFFIKNCFSKMASSPTKHGELLAANIPVVCNEIGDLKEIVEFKNAGILVGDFNKTDYQKAIHELLSNSISPESFNLTAQKYYSLIKGQEKYLSIYQTI